MGEGDTGPNTGGMGSYSPAPVVTPRIEAEVMEDIVRATARAMVQEGCSFRGVLFAGLMIKNNKVGVPVIDLCLQYEFPWSELDVASINSQATLLEHNVRFGDPECQSLMMRLESDLLPVLIAACEGRLADVQLQWSPQVALTDEAVRFLVGRWRSRQLDVSYELALVDGQIVARDLIDLARLERARVERRQAEAGRRRSVEQGGIGKLVVEPRAPVSSTGTLRSSRPRYSAAVASEPPGWRRAQAQAAR